MLVHRAFASAALLIVSVVALGACSGQEENAAGSALALRGR
jgi:hypothetical protein